MFQTKEDFKINFTISKTIYNFKIDFTISNFYNYTISKLMEEEDTSKEESKDKKENLE